MFVQQRRLAALPSPPVYDAFVVESVSYQRTRYARHDFNVFNELDRFRRQLVEPVRIAVARIEVVHEGEGHVGRGVQVAGLPEHVPVEFADSPARTRSRAHSGHIRPVIPI